MSVAEAAPLTWWQDDPTRAAAERAAMAKAAPRLKWIDRELADTVNARLGFELLDARTAGWYGQAPLWPFPRPRPPGLEDLVDGRPFVIQVRCLPVHPMTAPLVRPLSVQVPRASIGSNTWHSAGNGGLCLFRGTAWWNPATRVADLIPKISGWYLEFHLMTRGRLSRMPDRGIDVDPGLDRHIED